MSVIVSCPTKFYSFDLAEQLNKNHLLTNFYTIYFTPKNKITSVFNKRIDKENINLELVKTIPYLSLFYRLPVNDFYRNELFDRLVAMYLSFHQNNYKIFIGWSGISFNSMLKAKEKNKIVILERASSHILYQNNILIEEYKKFNWSFEINKKVIEKELKEYNLADYITVPSNFVKKTFLANGVPETKIFVNNFGASNFFQPIRNKHKTRNAFKILYLGNLNIRKGLVYLFKAVNDLDIKSVEFWIIGRIELSFKPIVEKYKRHNWKVFGYKNHYELAKYVSQCDVAVQPSIEEGLSMVIPQILKCGVPVIATTNTGGEDIINDGVNGFIVPICDSEAIRNKLETLMQDKALLMQMKENAVKIGVESLSWDKYGERYKNFIEKILQ